MPRKAYISVTNDLVTDQRVDKVARTLIRMGFEVVMIGRKLPDSLPVNGRLYQTVRFRLPFHKGPLFYASYNVALFFYLLFQEKGVLVSNDVDTLPANFFIHRIKRSPIVYDSHEYYTGVPELTDRNFVRKFWRKIESYILPRLSNTITVNESIARLYENDYGIKMKIVRNLPEKVKHIPQPNRKELGLPASGSLIILQGAGINIDRGAEEAVEAMQFIQHAVLMVVGGGDVMPVLRDLVTKLHLEDKVLFIPKQTPENLVKYTVCADAGLSLDKDTNINYRYSLPNKLFDYIAAGVPVIVSPLVEVKKIVLQYNIGLIIDNHDPAHIASKINELLSLKDKNDFFKENLNIAAENLCWENEEKVLTEIYAQYC